jgi:DNA processing protein
MERERIALLALSQVPGLGAWRAHKLIKEFGGASNVLALARRRLDQLLSPEGAMYVASGSARRSAENTLGDLEKKKDIQIMTLGDDVYPQLLREIADPPLVLYYRGNPSLLQIPGVAVVGSRRCSVYGKEVTQKLARDLAQCGLVVVSGLARGIDSEAHVGALEVQGKTAAVLGNGVDVVYPRENRKLYEGIRLRGCVISEFPCGSYPAPQNFPIRNRIISGLCYGTLIVEASEFSGSLITARLTLEQNRELWAVPGNITNPGSYGPNHLIKQGAKPVMQMQDVLDELPVYVLDLLARGVGQQAVPAEKPALTDSEKQILEMLSSEEATLFDRLLEKSGLSISVLNRILLDLEMKSVVRQLPGRRFCRKLL